GKHARQGHYDPVHAAGRVTRWGDPRPCRPPAARACVPGVFPGDTVSSTMPLPMPRYGFVTRPSPFRTAAVLAFGSNQTRECSRGCTEMPDACRTLLAALSAVTLAACDGGSDAAGGLGGSVQIDGSSTVFPVAEAMAEEFQIEHPEVRVTAGMSGTGGGFQRFCAGETDFTNASRPISPDESEACAATGIEHTTLTVGWDG